MTFTSLSLTTSWFKVNSVAKTLTFSDVSACYAAICGVVVRRIPKFGFQIPTNLLTIWKKIRTNPDSNPNPKNRKKIRYFKKSHKAVQINIKHFINDR
jgi:hypothetical protein